MDEVVVTREGAVMTLTLNRPEVLNAFTRALHSALADGLAQAADPAVRAVVITGAGRGFCVGQDLTEFGRSPDVGETLRVTYHPNVLAIRALEKPVIAAINGPAAGAGLSLACACDIRVAADTASLIPAFVNIGLIPDAGGSYFINRILGTARAFAWMSSGQKLTAAEAHEWGLVSEVVEADQLLTRVAEIAAMYAALPTRGIAMTKQLMDHAGTATLDEQLALEALMQAEATKTDDFREGVAAFVEKRQPVFTGKPVPPPHPISLVVTDDLRRWRLTVLLRGLLAFPHELVVASWGVVAAVVALAGWVVALVRGRVPDGVHAFLSRYIRYATHVYAYTYLVADPFPGFRGWRGTYPVDVEIAPPLPQSRWKTAFRLVLAIPAIVLAVVLYSVLRIVFLFGWFVSIALGRMPKGMRDLSAYCLRYNAQTWGYVLLLTDEYPTLATGLTADGELVG